MNLLAKIGIGAATAIGAAAAGGFALHRSAMSAAEDAFSRIAGDGPPATKTFDPAMVKDLPEIAQRYFKHAIRPGTPIYSSAQLTMTGTFLLGDKNNHQRYRMDARQAIRAPAEFVWLPTLKSGPMLINGSDGLRGGAAWTRFWLFGIVPVTNQRTSADLVRSAEFRAAVESAIWLPTSLLPGSGAEWEQLSESTARVTFTRFAHPIALELTMDEAGAVRRVVGQRWSNANADKAFRLQPFGGTMLAEAAFGGMTVPSRMAVGNHFGTADYLPFFQAEITSIRYH